MRYKEIRKKALLIDRFIDINKKPMKLPIKEVDIIIRYLFPSCYIRNKGWYKTVFKICAKNGPVVLKIGKKDSIENDHRVYKSLPRSIRRKYFARIFWHTKYCLLQEYGEAINLTKADIDRMKLFGKKHGLVDIKKDNIRMIDGRLKIIDATLYIPGPERINFIKDAIKSSLSRS
jgi:hypothetical protein